MARYKDGTVIMLLLRRLFVEGVATAFSTLPPRRTRVDYDPMCPPSRCLMRRETVFVEANVGCQGQV